MRSTTIALVGGVLLCGARTAAAQEGVTGGADRFTVSARSQSYVQLFRRALLPGPGGALIESETLAPFYEYVSVRAKRLDLPWSVDSADIEMAGWVRGLPIGGRLDPEVDGDVQTAFVTLRHRSLEARFGRQQVVGGAARFTRFDGLLVGVDSAAGLSGRAYAGFAVLPRWNERPYYLHLGSAADSLVRDASVTDELQRQRYWLGGAALAYRARAFDVSTSFHEQREDDVLARRSLGLDAHARLSSIVSVGGSGVLDVDSARMADGRAWLDLAGAAPLSLTFEYLHTEPALWLSRQSVLSVFSTSRFDEAGGAAALRFGRGSALEAAAFATLYDDHRPGARTDTTLRLSVGSRTGVRLGYRRVLAADNGYHAVRASLQQRLTSSLVGVLDSYQYLYDRDVAGYGASSVYAGSVTYASSESWSLLWGASLSRTPYAALEAQTLARLELTWDATLGAGR